MQVIWCLKFCNMTKYGGTILPLQILGGLVPPVIYAHAYHYLLSWQHQLTRDYSIMRVSLGRFCSHWINEHKRTAISVTAAELLTATISSLYRLVVASVVQCSPVNEQHEQNQYDACWRHQAVSGSSRVCRWKMVLICHCNNNSQCVPNILIGATTVGTGGDWSPQLLGWGPTVYWSPNFGRSFQKARNFTASSHQNAGFSIWVFKNFPGVIPPDPHSGRGQPSPALNTQPGFWPGVGRKRPGVGTQTLVPLNFSAVVAPQNILWISKRVSHDICTGSSRLSDPGGGHGCSVRGTKPILRMRCCRLSY